MKKLLLIFLMFVSMTAFSQEKNLTYNKLEEDIEQLHKELKECKSEHAAQIKDLKEDGRNLYSDTHKHITLYSWLISSVLLVVTIIIGIGVPLVMNRRFEKSIDGKMNDVSKKLVSIEKIETNIKALETRVDTIAKEAEDSRTAAEEAAKEAKINKLFSEALNEKDFDKKIELYSEVIKLCPDDISAHHNRGLAHGKKGEYDKAIEDFNITISLDSDHDSAYHNRGFAYRKLAEGSSEPDKAKYIGLAEADEKKSKKLKEAQAKETTKPTNL